jgi:uncharacterized protein (AIM24 family)
MSGRILCRAAAAAAAAVASLALLAPSASGVGATVLHLNGIPDCFFEPGDVPGVDVAFDAQCVVVFTPTGGVIVTAHGQLPAGFTLEQTFVGTLPCLGGTGRVTATPSGEVNATCQL